MRAKPKTTYVAASPQTWELVRAAYLSGLSGPTVAARFGVSVTALRKRAAREGWTKQAFARARDLPAHDPALALAHAPGHAYGRVPAPPPARDAVGAGLDAIVERHMVSLHVEPEQLARRALGLAARAVAEGRGLEAGRLARAAKAIGELNDVLPPAGWGDDEADGDPDGRRAHLRAMAVAIALNLAERIVAGRPLPPEFEAARREREEERGERGEG